APAGGLFGVAVGVAGDGFGDDAVGKIAMDEGAVSVVGVAVAAGTGRVDRDRLAGAQETLSSRRGLDAGAVHDAAAAAVVAAEEAPRARQPATAVDEGVTVVALGADLTSQAEAAAPLARAPRVLDQRVALDHQRILGLQRLHRQVRGVG